MREPWIRSLTQSLTHASKRLTHLFTAPRETPNNGSPDAQLGLAGSNGEHLTEFQRDFLEIYPPAHMFAVISWGCAATSWLAAVLNSHPDIFCVHAANWFWRTFGGAPALDGVPYMRLIGSQGYGFVAAGDVHGLNRAHVPLLRKVFPTNFNAAVVTRDPIPRFVSQMGLFRRLERHQQWDLRYVDSIIEQKKLSLPNQTYSTRFVVHAANSINSIIEERSVGSIYRAEDVTKNPEILGQLILDLTCTKVRPTDEWLELAMCRQPLNSHTDSVTASMLTEWEQDIIRRVVAPEAWDLYEQLGYRRPNFL